MLVSRAFTAQGIQGGDWLILGRLLREDASNNMIPCVPADVASITRYLVDLSDGTTVLFTDTLVVADAVLPALSTGDVWNLDNLGFNVRDLIPGSKLTASLGIESQYVILLSDGVVVKVLVDLDLKHSN